MPLRIGERPRTSQSSALARALIWRRRIAEMPTITGSQWLSWLPTTNAGPLSGSISSPPARRRRQSATGLQTAIAVLYIGLGSLAGSSGAVASGCGFVEASIGEEKLFD